MASNSQEAEQIPIESIGERFGSLRIIEPRAERAMVESMSKYGQLTPVVVFRIAPDRHELLDGFKRLRAGRHLGIRELTVRSWVVSLRAAKAAMLQLNRVGRAISTLEEAMVVHSLIHDDGLSQVEIGLLLGRHKSWVSRRASIISRLSDEVQNDIRLGLLPASLGVELARLQRCNQERVLESIRKHHLTWRETRHVVAMLMHTARWGHDAILRDPRGMIRGEEIIPDLRGDFGLSDEGKRIRGKLLALESACRDVALLLSGTDLHQFEKEEERRLRAGCAETLASLECAGKELREAAVGPGGGMNPE